MLRLLLCFPLFVACATQPISPTSTDDTEIVSTQKIDREGIRKVFLDNQKTLQKCYNNVLAKDQSLSGKMVLDFAISTNGVVTYAKNATGKSQINNDALNNCICKNVLTWRFPEPPPKQTIQVYYPMNFSK